jgi:hypothetical protein
VASIEFPDDLIALARTSWAEIQRGEHPSREVHDPPLGCNVCEDAGRVVADGVSRFGREDVAGAESSAVLVDDTSARLGDLPVQHRLAPKAPDLKSGRQGAGGGELVLQ